MSILTANPQAFIVQSFATLGRRLQDGPLAEQNFIDAGYCIDAPAFVPAGGCKARAFPGVPVQSFTRARD